MSHDRDRKRGPALLPDQPLPHDHGPIQILFGPSSSPSSPSVSAASTAESHFTIGADPILSPMASVLPNRFLDALRREHRSMYEHSLNGPAAAANVSSSSSGSGSGPNVPTVLVTDATDAPAAEHNGQRRFSQFYLGLRRFSNSHTVEFGWKALARKLCVMPQHIVGPASDVRICPRGFVSMCFLFYFCCICSCCRL